MKDKKLRKKLFGYWHTETNEDGGPDMVFSYGLDKFGIPVGEGIVYYFLKKIKQLEDNVEWLNKKLEDKKK